MLIDKEFLLIKERYLNGKFTKEDFIALLAECSRLKEAVSVAHGKNNRLIREVEFLKGNGKTNLKISPDDLS